MRLEHVPIGARFYTTAIPEVVGAVVRHGESGTVVRWETKSHRTIELGDGGFVEFDAPGKPACISSGAEVTLV